MAQTGPGAGGGSAVTGGQIAAEARNFIGDPYVWGADGPASFDCSGLVQYTLGQLGLSAPRTSQDQWAWVKRIPASQVTAGDLVFFTGADPPSPGHVGIVTSPGKMIDAPYTGADVRVDSYDYPGSGDMKVVGFGRVPSTSPGGAAGSGGGGPSILGDFLDGLLGQLGGQSLPQDASGNALTGINGVGGALAALAKEFEGVAKILDWLQLPSSWARIFAGIGGAAFLGAGIYLIGKEAKTS
jgi:hypothetical protein